MRAQISENILSLNFVGMSQLHPAPLNTTNEIEFQINEKNNLEPTISWGLMMEINRLYDEPQYTLRTFSLQLILD